LEFKKFNTVFFPVDLAMRGFCIFFFSGFNIGYPEDLADGIDVDAVDFAVECGAGKRDETLFSAENIFGTEQFKPLLLHLP
jgi:hypothetical protein